MTRVVRLLQPHTLHATLRDQIWAKRKMKREGEEKEKGASEKMQKKEKRKTRKVIAAVVVVAEIKRREEVN